MLPLIVEGDQPHSDASRVVTWSVVSIWTWSLLAGLSALGLALSAQWLIYDDLLHVRGPLEIAGCVLTGFLMFLLVLRSRQAARRRELEIVERLTSIRWMNDRIRNSLQAIECVTYAVAPHATDDVRCAVDAIEKVLSDFLAEGDLRADRKASPGVAQELTDPQL